MQNQMMETKYKEEVLKSFISDCQVRNFSSGTIVSYKGHIKCFLSLYSLNTTKTELSEFLTLIRDVKKLSPSTVENYFVSLSTFYDFLKYEQIVNENPIIPFRKRYLHYFKTPKAEERQLITKNR